MIIDETFRGKMMSFNESSSTSKFVIGRRLEVVVKMSEFCCDLEDASGDVILCRSTVSWLLGY